MNPVDWGIAAAVSLAVCGLMVLIGPRDAPDGGRKDQPRPIPSGGGIGIAAGAIAAVAFDAITSPIGLPAYKLWLYGGAVLFLLIGFADDWFDIPAGRKTLVLGVVCLMAAAVGWIVFAFGEAGRFEAWAVSLLILGGALWLFVFTNAANFMDGSNGLSLGSMAIMLVALAYLQTDTLILVAAIMGFLVWNLSGRLFAGDAGAFFVGVLVAGIGLQGAYWGVYSIWFPPLIGLPFLVDIILTVIWRARRGGNVMQAHREHAYQLFRRAGWGHLSTALVWWGMSALCGGLAIWAAGQSDLIQLASFWVAAMALSALWHWQRAIYWPRVSSPG